MNTNSLKDFYSLTKPGIIRGNLITTTAGFFLAAKGDIDFGLLLAMLVGLGLIVASACVFNNFLDRDIDAKMERTKKRALATGQISAGAALAYGSILGILGVTILILWTNLLAAAVAIIGHFFYVFVYGIAKRVSVHGTVVGSISGAVPPVVGYTAVTPQIDLAAGLLFLILVFWQMPHFYAIAIFRMKDYAAASIPVLPIKKGIEKTKNQMLAYIIAFTVVASLLTVLDYTGYIYLTVVILLGIAWLWRGIKGLERKDDVGWARMMFGFSLIVITLWSLLLVLDNWLP